MVEIRFRRIRNMAYCEILAERLRKALAHLPSVEEKKMFGGLAFMVNHKMCLTAGPDRIMCRIDPDVHEDAIEKKGVSTVVMRGRDYKGYVYVNEEALQKKSDFDNWVSLALAFNKNAKVSDKRKKVKKDGT